MRDKFTLFHIALYSKGWYKIEHKGNTIWDDLKIMFELDDYNGEFMTPNNMVSVLLEHCQILKKRQFTDLGAFASGIDKQNSYKFGYYTKGCKWSESWGDGKELPEWDYLEAIVRFCLSTLADCRKEILCGEGGRLPMPDYTKGIKRNKGVSNKALEEHFGVKTEKV